jgi:hypothetical protein
MVSAPLVSATNATAAPLAFGVLFHRLPIMTCRTCRSIPRAAFLYSHVVSLLVGRYRDRCENWAWEWKHWQTSYAMRTLGKVLLAILVGVAALVIGEFALGFLFGALNGAFGWPIPTSTTRNIILLTLFVIGIFIYRQKHSPKP